MKTGATVALQSPGQEKTAGRSVPSSGSSERRTGFEPVRHPRLTGEMGGISRGRAPDPTLDVQGFAGMERSVPAAVELPWVPSRGPRTGGDAGTTRLPPSLLRRKSGARKGGAVCHEEGDDGAERAGERVVRATPESRAQMMERGAAQGRQSLLLGVGAAGSAGRWNSGRAGTGGQAGHRHPPTPKAA